VSTLLRHKDSCEAVLAVAMELEYSSLENKVRKMEKHIGDEMVPLRLTVSHITLPG
jgi:hypothetical protein